jgi:hypothetical protein
MHQDIIQNFLGQSEVIGIALMQGRIIPYFYVKENFIDPETRVELIRHFRSNILETPTLSNCLEFEIDSYYAYTYKINESLTLLIISFQKSITVKAMITNILNPAFQEDLDVTIKLFEQLTKKILQPVKTDSILMMGDKEISLSPQVFADKPIEEDYSIEELVETLNTLSQTVCSYLGPKITSNFWQLTRPNHEWLCKFTVKSNANINFSGSIKNVVSPLQHLLIRDWTNKFANRCSRIIRDLPSIIDQRFQDKKYRKIISILPNGYLNEIEYSSSKENSLFEKI